LKQTDVSNQLFALSTQAYSYLQQKGGYEPAEPALLPAERRAKYVASGRNSKVLLKALRS
jgi:amino-acid N-acetyltransferase